MEDLYQFSKSDWMSMPPQVKISFHNCLQGDALPSRGNKWWSRRIPRGTGPLPHRSRPRTRYGTSCYPKTGNSAWWKGCTPSESGTQPLPTKISPTRWQRRLRSGSGPEVDLVGNDGETRQWEDDQEQFQIRWGNSRRKTSKREIRWSECMKHSKMISFCLSSVDYACFL